MDLADLRKENLKLTVKKSENQPEVRVRILKELEVSGTSGTLGEGVAELRRIHLK